MKKAVISCLSLCLLFAVPGCCPKKQASKGNKETTTKSKKMKKDQDMHMQVDIEEMDEDTDYNRQSLSKF